MARRRHRTHSTADLRQIGLCQKVLILCMIAYVVVWVGFIGLMATAGGRRGAVRDQENLFQIALVLTGVIGVLGAVFVLWGVGKASGTVLGVILGILTLIPCVSLISIVIANAQVTGVLQRNGVRVGLLGARLADIRNLPEMTDADGYDEDEDDRPNRRRRRAAEIDEDEGW